MAIKTHVMNTKTIDTAHTPGPWFVHANQVYSEHNGQTVAVFPGVRSDEPVSANAHLIAAAPDLLEAVELYLELSPDQPANLSKLARAAIKKARGQA